MTFYVQWSGHGRDFPGIDPGTDDPATSKHAEQIAQMLELYVAEHADDDLSVSLSAHVTPLEPGGEMAYLSLSVSTRTHSTEGGAVDSSQGPDPFAPEPTQPAAESTPAPDPAAEAEPQPAVDAPAPIAEGSDVPPPAAGSEPENEPAIGSDSSASDEAPNPEPVIVPGETVLDQPLAGAGAAVNAETGDVTQPGEPLPPIPADASPADATPLPAAEPTTESEVQ